MLEKRCDSPMSTNPVSTYRVPSGKEYTVTRCELSGVIEMADVVYN